MRKLLSILLAGSMLLMVSCNSNQQEESTESEAHEIVKVEEFEFIDNGPGFFTVDLEDFTKANTNFRTAVWTGEQMQMTLMSIPVGGEIGEEIHNTIEQFIRIEEGEGEVYIGETQETMKAVARIGADEIVFVPLGVWHNIKNVGDVPMKVYSIYAPAEHPHGTIHVTYEEAMADEHDHDH